MLQYVMLLLVVQLIIYMLAQVCSELASLPSEAAGDMLGDGVFHMD